MLGEFAKNDGHDRPDDQGGDRDLPVEDDRHDQSRDTLGDLGHGLAEHRDESGLKSFRITDQAGDVFTRAIGDDRSKWKCQHSLEQPPSCFPRRPGWPVSARDTDA